jgi:hypothetical protein
MPQSQRVHALAVFVLKCCMNLSSSMCATCLAHLILLDLIYFMSLREEHNLWSSSLYHSPQHSVKTSHSVQMAFLSTLLTYTLSLCSTLWARNKLHVHMKNK